jgi:CxxC motif-containing protein (DUF1111 family)
MFQATLPVPGRVIPNDPDVERAVAVGERVFDEIRCTSCHVPALRLSANSPKVTLGNRKFLTRRLWGVGNQSPYFHHGLFTTMRQAVLAHAGEALEQREAFDRLAKYEKDALIEFLKSLQVLPPSSKALIVDERGQPKVWPRVAVTY